MSQSEAYSFFQPRLETFLNVWQRGFSQKNMMDVGLEELSEINLPKVKKPNCKT